MKNLKLAAGAAVLVLTLLFTPAGCDDLPYITDDGGDEIEDPDDNNDDNDPDNDNEDPDDEPDSFIFNAENIVKIINEHEGTPDNPAWINLHDTDLGLMSDTESNWHILLRAIADADGEYVALDLSDCKMTLHKYFNPDSGVSYGKGKIIQIILPDAATSIVGVNESSSEFAFMYFTNLMYISGKNITLIGRLAFFGWALYYGCSNLIEADFPAATIIDASAFESCQNLKIINFPLAKTLGHNSFNGCISLTDVDFPEVEVLHSDTFNGCINLETAIFPKVRILQNSIFSGFARLTAIDFSSASYIAANAFKDCTSLLSAEFPNVTAMEPDAFNGCINLETAIFPKVDIIHSRTFFNNTKLTTTDFLSVVHIADHAFYNCTNLTEITFPKATVIEPMAFGNCTSLTTARFLANPEPALDANQQPVHPLYPWLNQMGGLPCVSETILFYNLAFNGCTSLETLDVRNAWNVYFVGNALVNIGESLNLYLFDDSGVIDNNGDIRTDYTGRSYGHPQLDIYLGADPSLKSITIHAPNGTQIEKWQPGYAGYPGIVADIKSRYSNIAVTVQRYN